MSIPAMMVQARAKVQHSLLNPNSAALVLQIPLVGKEYRAAEER